MPTHEVILTPRAVADLEAIYDHIANDSPEYASRMVKRLSAAIDSLADLPDRYAPAREARYHKRPLRQFVVSPYRIVYEVERAAVRVITIRHGRQRTLKPGDAV